MPRQRIGAVFSKRPLQWQNTPGEGVRSEHRGKGTLSLAGTSGMESDPISRVTRRLATTAGSIVALVTIMAATLVTTAGPAAANSHTSSLAASVKLSAPPRDCPRGYLCLYDLPNYRSTHTSGPLKLYTCGDYSLERFNYIHGGSWRDKSQS